MEYETVLNEIIKLLYDPEVRVVSSDEQMYILSATVLIYFDEFYERMKKSKSHERVNFHRFIYFALEKQDLIKG